MLSDDLAQNLQELHNQWTVIQELPGGRTASHWIVEAEAITADLVAADVSKRIIHDRFSHVHLLLGNVENTGHPIAMDYLLQSKRLTTTICKQSYAE